MAEHPGIVFREGAAGRRAALAGHRLDVWQVIETLHAEGGKIDAVAKFLALSRGLVDAALGYYADYQDEVEELIRRNAAMATDAEQAWHRRQAALNP